MSPSSTFSLDLSWATHRQVVIHQVLKTAVSATCDNRLQMKRHRVWRRSRAVDLIERVAEQFEVRVERVKPPHVASADLSSAPESHRQPTLKEMTINAPANSVILSVSVTCSPHRPQLSNLSMTIFIPFSPSLSLMVSNLISPWFTICRPAHARMLSCNPCPASEEEDASASLVNAAKADGAVSESPVQETREEREAW